MRVGRGREGLRIAFGEDFPRPSSERRGVLIVDIMKPDRKVQQAGSRNEKKNEVKYMNDALKTTWYGKLDSLGDHSSTRIV
jgi:hypothetical protein